MSWSDAAFVSHLWLLFPSCHWECCSGCRLSLIYQMCIRSEACFSILTTHSLFPKSNLFQNITPCYVFPLKGYSLIFTLCINRIPFAYPLGPSKGNVCMFFIKYLQDLRYNRVNCGCMKGKYFQILFDMNVAYIHRNNSNSLQSCLEK